MGELRKVFLIFLISFFLIPIIFSANFSISAQEKVANCDLEPNGAKVHLNSKFFPFIRNDGGDWPRDRSDIADENIPPSGYVWEVFVIKNDGDNGKDHDIIKKLGEIKTVYVDVRDEDGNIKIQFDADKMIMDKNLDGRFNENNIDLDAVTYSDFSSIPGFSNSSPNDDYELYAEGKDPQPNPAHDKHFFCDHKADDWTIINSFDKDLLPDPEEEQKFDPDPVDTSVGEVPTEPFAFAGAFVRIAIGIAGGVSFLLMIFGAFRLIFAGGNPESIDSGRQIITAAIIGLILVVFSIFIIRLIGVSILGLPL